ncbi:DNA gyrase inhibitor YacG [Methylobacterium sp. EM32]|uniref:DNA gyrase inhibitor YacG n=1 Tax=Methylobacterium sp. EM32 TaxID=3163481 RepID=UPI0033ADA160
MTTTEDAKAPACPICGKPAVPEFKPFCSKRCADVDLQRWLSGRYAIPGREDDALGQGSLGEDDGSRED